MRVFIYVQKMLFSSAITYSTVGSPNDKGECKRFLYAVSVGLSLLGTEKTTLLLALLLAGCADTVLLVR